MPKDFCNVEFKVCGFFMVFSNLVFGLLLLTIKASDLLANPQNPDKRSMDLFFFGLGFLFIVNTISLLYGTVKKKEKWIFFYVVAGSTSLFVVTAASGFSKYDIKIIIVLFSFLWIGQICVYSFYKNILKSKVQTVDVRFIDQNGTIHHII